jgi:hypothetical protein
MAATATAEYGTQPPPTVAVKSKIAAMDAIEDITFGSVSHSPKTIFKWFALAD